MKTSAWIFLFFLLAGIVLQSCSRAMTPYEAANNPRGKNCRSIK
jgi:hypothetical protein